MKYLVKLFDGETGIEKTVEVEADYFDIDAYSFRENRQPTVTFHKIISLRPYRQTRVAYFPQFIYITSEEKK